MNRSFSFFTTLLSLALFFALLTGCKKAEQVSETCSDGMLNQNETGIDCGGVCKPFPNLYGSWRVYKYLLNNIDKTTFFAARYPDYSLSFSESGNYEEVYLNPDTVKETGTYQAENPTLTCDFERIDLSANGITRRYSVFNLTAQHMQLRNDTSQLYLDKY